MTPLFTFPMLSIGRTMGAWAEPGKEVMHALLEDGEFDLARDDLDRDGLDGLLLFDSGGRSWKIVGVQDLTDDPTFGDRLFYWYRKPRGLIRRRIHCEFAELEPWSLEWLRERVCAAIISNPDQWRDDEAIAGEDGHPQDEQEMRDEFLARVRKASSVPQILDVLFDYNLSDASSEASC